MKSKQQKIRSSLSTQACSDFYGEHKSILEEGLKPQHRLHVHLSSNIETAINVGKRHGIPIVFKVDAQKMFKDGAKFYLSRNGVWLTDYVAAEYLSLE